MHRNVAAHGEVSNLGDSLILEKDICSHPFVVLSSYSFSSPTWQWRWERRRSQVECSSPGYLGVQTFYLVIAKNAQFRVIFFGKRCKQGSDIEALQTMNSEYV